MISDHYPPGTTAADLDAAAWDAPDALPDPTWSDFERYQPEPASKIDEQFISESADHGDLNDLLTALEARRMGEVIRVGDRVVRDRACFRHRRMRGAVVEPEARRSVIGEGAG
jgi:hypothetical protein